VDDKKKEEDDEEEQQQLYPKEEVEMSLLQIFHRVSQIPVFICLVAQGLFGASECQPEPNVHFFLLSFLSPLYVSVYKVPWDMMSFILLLLEWKDFTRQQIISFQVSAGVFGTLGAFLGGVLGDYFAFLPRGRIYIALISVIGGTIFYGLFPSVLN